MNRGCFRCWLGKCPHPEHADEVAPREPSTKELIAERENLASRVKQIDAELAKRHIYPEI